MAKNNLFSNNFSDDFPYLCPDVFDYSPPTMTKIPSFLRRCVGALACVLAALPLAAEDAFSRWFEPRTLRVDLTFAGDSARQAIYLDELSCQPGWAGRRVRLDSLYLAGNGRILLRDEATGHVIYRHSFSTLFQEWQATEEATQRARSFENVFLLPFPKQPVRLEVELNNLHREVTARYACRVDPADILIRRTDTVCPPHRYLVRSGSSADCIDVAIVAEGYTEAEADSFYSHARQAVDALFAHEPFGHLRPRFNVVAVALPSRESGVSLPASGQWRTTALGSHFDTFYSDRYLTTLRLKRLHDAMGALPYEHLIILANTDEYGGGGIFNSYTLAAARDKWFLPVVVHEFGHSFGGLADEYAYDDGYVAYYTPDVEPWERNITTLARFDTKWKDLLKKGEAAPTPPESVAEGDTETVGLFEGAGYQSKGVFRACRDCRMRVNTVSEFCPVCQRSLEGLIRFYTDPEPAR